MLRSYLSQCRWLNFQAEAACETCCSTFAHPACDQRSTDPSLFCAPLTVPGLCTPTLFAQARSLAPPDPRTRTPSTTGRLQFPPRSTRQQLTLPLLPEFPLQQRLLGLVPGLARIPATHVMSISQAPLSTQNHRHAHCRAPSTLQTHASSMTCLPLFCRLRILRPRSSGLRGACRGCRDAAVSGTPGWCHAAQGRAKPGTDQRVSPNACPPQCSTTATNLTAPTFNTVPCSLWLQPPGDAASDRACQLVLQGRGSAVKSAAAAPLFVWAVGTPLHAL